MNSNKGKKVVFLIVEGPTDEVFFENYKQENGGLDNVNVIIIQLCDSECFRDVKKFKIKMSEAVTKELNNKYSHISLEQIVGVFHLIDTDGMFIPTKKIKKGVTGSKQYYDVDNKQVKIAEDSIKDIWEDKRIIINDFLQSTEKTLNVQDSFGKKNDLEYSLYFNSINLESILYHDPNISKKEKTYFKKYVGPSKYQLATIFIQESEKLSKNFSKITTIIDAWDYIKQNPWEQISTIPLMFEDLKKLK